jgi:hypothetical protein
MRGVGAYRQLGHKEMQAERTPRHKLSLVANNLRDRSRQGILVTFVGVRGFRVPPGASLAKAAATKKRMLAVPSCGPRCNNGLRTTHQNPSRKIIPHAQCHLYK